MLDTIGGTSLGSQALLEFWVKKPLTLPHQEHFRTNWKTRNDDRVWIPDFYRKQE